MSTAGKKPCLRTIIRRITYLSSNRRGKRVEIWSFNTFGAAWRNSIAFLRQLNSWQLSLIAVLALAYGVFAEPALRGFPSYAFQWFLKCCGFVICVLACARYLAIAKREDVARLQWPVKFIVSALASLVVLAVAWFLLWLLVDTDGGTAFLAWMQVVGVFVTLAFFLAWGALGDVFKAGRQDRVLYAAGIALAAQVVVALLAYFSATQPDTFADVGGPGLGAAAVAVFFAAALIPPAVGLLVFQFVLLLAWSATSVKGNVQGEK